MPLLKPRFAVLDSSTLIKIANDYWSSAEDRRRKARNFINVLTHNGIYVSFTYSHVSELLRHENEGLVRSRLAFLRGLPLIAWLRPYDRSWFPGCPVDLLRRELHAFAYDSARTWSEIIDIVRTDLWETGTGAEMFIEDDRLWDRLRQEFQRELEHEKYVASITRTAPGYVDSLTLGEIAQLPRRVSADRPYFLRWLYHDLRLQLESHGDKKLSGRERIASDFTRATLERVERFEANGFDPIQQMLLAYGVPTQLLTPEMTVGELGELAVYIEQIALIAEDLRPRKSLSVHEVPLNTLPSYVLQHRLARVQRKAERVSGSDLGDGVIAMLALYADALETDKRTHEYLKQVSRADKSLGEIMCMTYRKSDYSDLAGVLIS